MLNKTSRLMQTACALMVGVCLLQLHVADACMICLPMPQTTAADRLISGQAVVFARESGQRPFFYEAIEVLKGQVESAEIELFVDSSTRRRLTANDDLVVVLVRSQDEDNTEDNKHGVWRSIGVADPAYQQVVRRVLTMAPNWRGEDGLPRRYEFFAALLSHENRSLFELAYLEVARAPYSTIKRFAGLVPRNDLLSILERREYFEWRPLAILMLSCNATDQDRVMIKSQLDQHSRLAMTRNLAAWATAYIESDGVVAIREIETRYLQNQARTEAEVRAVIAALSIHAREGHTHLRQAIAHALSQAAEHHAFAADMIPQDLEDWLAFDDKDSSDRSHSAAAANR